ANNFQDKEIYNAELIKNKIPIVAIPTTAGAGAEATPFSVLSDKNTKLKAGAGHPFLFPDLSFVDPKYTFTTSKIVTRDSGLDALSHLLEGIYSNRRNKIIFPLIAKGINLIYKNLKKVMKYPDHKIARENMMIAALYGGMTIAQTSTTLQHSIGYPLTSRLGITHGAANAIVMKFIMRLFYPAVKSEFDDIMKLANLKKNKFIEFIESFDIDISNKSNASIIADNIQDITKQIMNSRNMLNNPIKIIECDILEIYKKLKLI
ncbi:MAG TPA: iron-containing alcohol dehydrogenase, partial [bacterium]|nr:iron-containing alcohol dehydrogenase [bacterium]